MPDVKPQYPVHDLGRQSPYLSTLDVDHIALNAL